MNSFHYDNSPSHDSVPQTEKNLQLVEYLTKHFLPSEVIVKELYANVPFDFDSVYADHFYALRKTDIHQDTPSEDSHSKNISNGQIASENSMNSEEEPEEDLKEKEEQTTLLQKKRKRNINICPFCDWKFPSLLVKEEKEDHIALCQKGKGKKNQNELLRKCEDKLKVMKRKTASFICPICFKKFRNAQKMRAHAENCGVEEEQ